MLKLKQVPFSTLSNNIELNENRSQIDIGFISDFNKSSNRLESTDDEDVPMLNPNYEPENSDEPRANELIESDHCHVPKSKLPITSNKVVWRKLITVLILCICFMIIEIIGGILAASISIQTDAAHMAADIAGFFFSIVALYVSEKEPTRRMSFGYYRSEVLGALFSTLIIWVLTGALVYLAILRVITQDFDIEPNAMIITAICGVVFNIIMYFVLHTNRCFSGVGLKHHGHSHSGDGHGHSHSGDGHHGHSHSTPKNRHTVLTMPINDNFNNFDESDEAAIVNVEPCAKQTNDRENINIRAAAIHVIGDFIQSIGVLIAAIIIYVKPEYKLADPICTFIFSVLVILTTAPIIKDIYFVLMEALPLNFNYDALVNDLCSIRNVRKAHNLHIWSLTMDKYALSVHLVVEKNSDTQEVLKEAIQLLRSKYKINRTTIQVEYFMESMDNCDQCKLPQ